MFSLQRHYILVLYWTIKRCTSDTNTTIYISTTSTPLSLNLTTSNIFTPSPSPPPQSQSLMNKILNYQVDGLNLIFLIVIGILLTCTFCSVCCYLCCQHRRRTRQLKEQIAANTPKRSLDAISEVPNEKDINITMDNGTSNTMTSSFDNNNNNTHTQTIHTNKKHDNMQSKFKSNDIPKYTDNNGSDNFGIGSPKNNVQHNDNRLPDQIEEISPQIEVVNSNSHKSPSPKNDNHHNGRYSRRSSNKSSHRDKDKRDKKHKNGTGHAQVPSNLAAEMEMASFIPMGMSINNNKSDESNTSLTSTDSSDDEKTQLKNNYPSPQTKKMRSFSRRTASLDNFKKKIAYDDMAEDPELAQYAQHIHGHSNDNGDDDNNNNNNNGKSAYKISNVGIEESDDSDDDSTTESSDDSSDDDSDDDDTTTDDSDEEGTSNEDSSSDDDDDTDSDLSQDGGHYDTTTGDMLENFGKGNINIIKGNKNISQKQQQYQKHLGLNKIINGHENGKKNNKSPKSKKKSPRKSPKKSPKKYDKYNANHKKIIGKNNDNYEHSSESTLKDDEVDKIDKINEISDNNNNNNNETMDIINPIKFVKPKNRVKKHHVADNSDAFGSYDNYDDNVKKVLKNDIHNQHDKYFQD